MNKVEDYLTKKYRLNPNSIPVKGNQRSIICDLGAYQYHLIPNSLFEILTTEKKTIISEVIEKYSGNDDEIKKTILEYFQFLIENDLIFFTEFSDNYLDIEMNWDFPAFISNAIIDFGINSTHDTKSLFNQLMNLGCRDIQIRFFREATYKEVVENILYFLKKSKIKSVELILPYIEEIKINEWVELTNTFPRIKYFQFYNAPEYKVLKESSINGMGFVTIVQEGIANKFDCGVISPYYFVKNIFSFTESLHHNSCLNRKISIDTEGNIKNCPSMPESFGNIKDTTLQEAIEKPGFKKYWDITKDKIHVCKDCEFRYICTDCRAYIEDPEDIYSKPLKCGYNPYTGEWSEWSTNPLKEKAIDFYGMRDII